MSKMAIMRCKKLSTMGTVAKSLQHCYREQDTPNADPSLTPLNEHRAARSTDDAMGRLRALLPEKRRKDAVLAVEYMMTASPEWWATASEKDRRAYFDNAEKWLADKYGKDRIITATVHRDETTPHLSAFVVPLTKDGKLSAKQFIGNATMMRNDQTSFAKAMAPLGLERGIEGSRAKHTVMRKLYAETELVQEQRPPSLDIPKAGGLLESKDEYGRRVATSIYKQVKPYLDAATAEAATARQEARRASEMAETSRKAREGEKAALAARDEAVAQRAQLAEMMKPFMELAQRAPEVFARTKAFTQEHLWRMGRAGKEYFGQIRESGKDWVVQRIGANNDVKHMAKDFTAPPEVGKSVRISYDDKGRVGQVQELGQVRQQERQQGRGFER